MRNLMLVPMIVAVFLVVGGMPIVAFGQDPNLVEKDVPDFTFGFCPPNFDGEVDSVTFDLWLVSKDDGDEVFVAGSLVYDGVADTLRYPFHIDQLGADDPHEFYGGKVLTNVTYDSGASQITLECITEQTIHWRRTPTPGCCWLE